MNKSAFILPTITLTFIIVLFSLTLNSKEFKIGGPTPISHLISNEMSDFEQTEKFDSEILKFMKYWDLKGGSFAIMRNDSLLYAKAYGYANLDQEIKCEVKNTFRVASVSKLLTATAIMKLVEDDRLKLNSLVFGEEGILCDTLFSDIKYANTKKITVEHLLRHTAGFSSPVGDPAFFQENISRVLEKKLPLSVDDFVHYAIQNRLKTNPGSSYDYSNLGYIILSKVVEVASGMEYERYMKEEILAAADCHDIYIGRNFSENRQKNEVQYYEVKEAEPVKAYDGSGRMTLKSNGGNNVTSISGAGGWVASPVEILRFVASINGSDVVENILTKESISTMTYDSKRDKPIGWASVSGKEWLRSGSMAGTTALIKQQKNGYTWVFITNSSSWNGHRLSRYMSTNISKYVSNVKEWPKRDLFKIRENRAEILEEIAAAKASKEEEKEKTEE
ncbi:MAG: serine hydrolase domain-containing protein [Rikenellaceae bacterium]